MERIVSFLMFAAIFYVMMRFGCGSHAVHGHRKAERSPGGAKDPVCGMEVESEKGYSERYRGREYRFCSRSCLDKFDANPAEFVHA